MMLNQKKTYLHRTEIEVRQASGLFLNDSGDHRSNLIHIVVNGKKQALRVSIGEDNITSKSLQQVTNSTS